MSETAQGKMLERGDIYFFYRPRVHGVGEKEIKPQSAKDIQRFYMILHPENDPHYRLLLVGRKRLPDLQKHEREWTTVDMVSKHPEELKDILEGKTYPSKTRGRRQQPEARSCGEGVYCIVASGRNTYLAYELELPKKPRAVQKTLNLLPKASYVISVKNQLLAGTFGGKTAVFPKTLQQKFHDLRFLLLKPTKFLNYTGAEILLIGAEKDIKKGAKLAAQKDRESFDEAKTFNDLKLWQNDHTIKPLFAGEWA